jgi:hypothetical protein
MPREFQPIEKNHGDSGRQQQNLITEANDYRQCFSSGRQSKPTDDGDGDGGINTRAVQKEWNKAMLDFGTAADLYQSSMTAKHPFTAAEIAKAGTISGITLNEFEAGALGNTAALAGNEHSDHLSMDQKTTVYSSLANEFPSTFAGMVYNESQRQVSQDVVQELGQTGSAGVEQAGSNDCWFEDSLASLASTAGGQKSIANMITQGPDDTYNVTFPGAPHSSVNVTMSDADDPRLGNSAQWANILEAAALKLLPDQSLHGSTSVVGQALLTGHTPSVGFSKGVPAVRLEQQIESQLAQGNPITAFGEAQADGPVESQHDYSVIGAKNGGVTVRNPWGRQEKQPDDRNLPAVGQTIDGVTNIGAGELQMPVATFQKDFPEVVVSKL